MPRVSGTLGGTLVSVQRTLGGLPGPSRGLRARELGRKRSTIVGKVEHHLASAHREPVFIKLSERRGGRRAARGRRAGEQGLGFGSKTDSIG
jgi:hypothetical protein